MLSPLRGWRIAVQYHFLNGHSSCGDAVVCRVEQFSTPKKRNFKTRKRGTVAFVSLAHASGYQKPMPDVKAQLQSSRVGLPKIHSFALRANKSSSFKG